MDKALKNFGLCHTYHVLDKTYVAHTINETSRGLFASIFNSKKPKRIARIISEPIQIKNGNNSLLKYNGLKIKQEEGNKETLEEICSALEKKLNEKITLVLNKQKLYK